MNRIGYALVATIMFASSAIAEVSVPDMFTESGRAMIRAHGPWPPSTDADPSNRFSGVEAAVDFGRALFFDVRLSADRSRSCASCHQPGYSFTDRLPRSMGLEQQDRNAPSLANLRLYRWYGWGGRSDTLWGQSIHPVVDRTELGLDPETLLARFIDNVDLAMHYQEVTGVNPDTGDAEILLVNTGKILAAYQETLVTPRTGFDEFRDALVSGDAARMAAYPAAAVRGLALFVGRGRCSVCHFGPGFSSGEFHHIGLSHFIDDDRVDPGRFAGIDRYRGSDYNLDGRFSDRPVRSQTVHVQQQPGNWGAFRVPSLRNVGNTAPYMHDGSLATLREVVLHYSEMDMERLHVSGESILQPLKLSGGEISDLVAFLRTLDGMPQEQ